MIIPSLSHNSLYKKLGSFVRDEAGGGREGFSFVEKIRNFEAIHDCRFHHLPTLFIAFGNSQESINSMDTLFSLALPFSHSFASL